VSAEAPLWVFGYGSLVFRPAFAFAAAGAGWVTGYARRFWQGSTDHRGVPGAPGRVVTLVPEAGTRCWGVAYLVEEALREEVLGMLDHREQGGYARHSAAVELAGGEVVEALVYVATAENEEYLGRRRSRRSRRRCGPRTGRAGATWTMCCAWPRPFGSIRQCDEHVEALARLLTAAG
jgi:cation transport protein ChaC